MKKSEIKAKAIEIINKQDNLVDAYTSVLGANDPETIKQRTKWNAMLDAFAELLDMSVCDLIHDCVWSR